MMGLVVGVVVGVLTVCAGVCVHAWRLGRELVGPQ